MSSLRSCGEFGERRVLVHMHVFTMIMDLAGSSLAVGGYPCHMSHPSIGACSLNRCFDNDNNCRYIIKIIVIIMVISSVFLVITVLFRYDYFIFETVTKVAIKSVT